MTFKGFTGALRTLFAMIGALSVISVVAGAALALMLGGVS